jgi:fucose permease
MSTTIKRDKLFWGACLSLMTTAFSFTVIAGIAFSVKQEFILNNTQLGMFTGVFFIGFTVAQIIFAPLCDTIGIRWVLRGAFVGHVGGALLIMTSQGYEMAVAGSMLAGVGAGLVEAGGNPLVAALFPDNKTTKLNRFHVWFPYGNLIAAILLSTFFKSMDIGWRGQLVLILIPALAYGVMLLNESYPPTESASAGVTVGESFKSLFSPIMWVMLPMMLLTASMELPPSSWVPSVLQSGGVNGLLVFGFIFGIMGTLRLFAGPIINVLTPTGVLLCSAILSTVGLYWFSFAETASMAFLTAAVWAVGIACFWPTMLGFVSERNPKSGALGLGAMGATGMLAAFFVAPMLGSVADQHGHSQLPKDKTVAIFEQVSRDFPALALAAGAQASDIQQVIENADAILKDYHSQAELPIGRTAQALRSVIGTGLDSPAVKQAQAILNPADNYGGRLSFRTLAPVGFILIAVFGFLFIQDRKKGGYRAEKLEVESK